MQYKQPILFQGNLPLHHQLRHTAKLEEAVDIHFDLALNDPHGEILNAWDKVMVKLALGATSANQVLQLGSGGYTHSSDSNLFNQ